MTQPSHRVFYYPPFTHYWGLDMFRGILIMLSVLAFAFVCLLAIERWQEARRSATYYLIATAVGLVELGVGEFLAFGHPLNWTLPLRVAFLVFIYGANARAVWEYRQPGGLWTRPSKG